jgi:pimeloyl-ACP methyl ester carboxylesterase
MIRQTCGEMHFTAGHWPLEAGRPVLLLLHGAGASSAIWRHQVTGLADRINVLALDLPGHGASGGEGYRDIASYAAAVVRCMDALQLERAVVGGLSMGGAICQQLLLDHASRFQAAILTGTGARLRVAPGIFEAIAGDYPSFVAGLAQLTRSPRSDPACAAPLLEATARCRPEVTAGDFTACDRFDVMNRLAAIRRPVLVVTGADDRLTPPKYGAYLARHIAGARQVQLEAAGHMMPLEQPAAFNQAVAAFLDEIGGRR